MKSSIIKISLISCFAVAFFACDPYEKLPKETVLTYISCEIGTDNSSNKCMRLHYYFEDGDGNIGLNSWDTLPPRDTFPYNSNFIIEIMDKNDEGEFVKMKKVDSSYVDPYTYRIEPFDVPGALKANLTLDITAFDYASMKKLSKNKIIRFDAYMFDQNLVPSNVAVSEEINVSD